MSEEAAVDELDWFTRLPDELCLSIFHCLQPPEVCKCMRVCRRWNSLCNDDSLWREIELDHIYVADVTLLAIALKRPKLRSLVFCSVTFLGCVGVSVWRKFQFLERVSFIACLAYTADSIGALVAACPNLRHFKYECSRDFTVVHLVTLFIPVRRYMELSLAHCTQIDDVAIYSVLQNPSLGDCLKTVRVLNMDGLVFLTDTGVQGILGKCPDLRSLTLDGDQLTDKTSLFISKNLQGLEHLNISYCDHLTDDTLYSFRELKALETLYLKKGPNFSNEALESLFEHLSCKREYGLRSLSLIECHGLTDSGLKKLARRFPHLVHLDLSWCWKLTDDGLESIAVHCHGIRTLKLVGLKEARCVPLLSTSLLKLQFLELVQTDLVDDDKLQALKRARPWITIVDYYGEEVGEN